MKEFSQHKFQHNKYLEKLYQSNKPLIIYKVDGGYNIYTDFSKKISLNKNNIENFLHSFSSKKYKKETDLYVGFFSYEILCSLLNLSLKNQKKMNFYKGIFYKPETLIKIRNKIIIHSNLKKAEFNKVFQKTKILSPFKLNINFNKYQKIFNTFSKRN